MLRKTLKLLPSRSLFIGTRRRSCDIETTFIDFTFCFGFIFSSSKVSVVGNENHVGFESSSRVTLDLENNKLLRI